MARPPDARELSMVAGAGLVFFEAAELGWDGFSRWRRYSRLLA